MLLRPSQRVTTALIFISVIVLCLIYTAVQKINYNVGFQGLQNLIVPTWPTADPLFCHYIRPKKSLPDISDNLPNSSKRNIFFLETSCYSLTKGKLFIKPRQACAVESAARTNPDMDVYILFASGGDFSEEDEESDRVLRMLGRYPNIKLRYFNVKKYVKGSPVENLWTDGNIRKSIYPMAHTSDILRLVTLWKFGGIYLDLDVVVIKSMKDFPENFCGAESYTVLANGVMGFSKEGKGRQYIEECLNDASKNFNGNAWPYNGPQLISRNIFGHCPQFDPATLVRFGKCDEFRIFPPSAFYLVPWQKWEWFFNRNLTDVIENYIEDRSYIMHVWNKLSAATNISKTDLDVPYLKFARKYCPGVIKELDSVF